MEAISGKSSKSSGIPEREAIQYRQKRFAILYNKALATGEVKNFDQLKYRQVIYQPGDYLQVYNYDDEDSPFVCKLNRIIALPESKGELPFILVDWCLRKRDLPSKVTGKYLQHISEAEVFPSNEQYCLDIASIIGKCIIITVEDYGNLELTSDNVYFTRSDYDTESECLLTAPEQWKTDCICAMPTNPDLTYLQCIRCSKWFHEKCVGCPAEDMDFFCNSCSKRTKK